MKLERNCKITTEYRPILRQGGVAQNQAIFRKNEQDVCFIIHHTDNQAQFSALTVEERKKPAIVLPN